VRILLLLVLLGSIWEVLRQQRVQTPLDISSCSSLGERLLAVGKWALLGVQLGPALSSSSRVLSLHRQQVVSSRLLVVQLDTA
jgi:hypothetical protein